MWQICEQTFDISGKINTRLRYIETQFSIIVKILDHSVVFILNVIRVFSTRVDLFEYVTFIVIDWKYFSLLDVSMCSFSILSFLSAAAV